MADTDPKEVVNQLIGATEQEVKAIILDIGADLVEQTPVATGWARANWIPSLDKALERPAGSRDGVDSSAKSRGVTAIASGYVLGRPAFITNNVPYIGKLNNGASKQAPAGYVDVAISKRVSEANRKKLG